MSSSPPLEGLTTSRDISGGNFRAFLPAPNTQELTERLPILLTPAAEDPMYNYLATASDFSAVDFDGRNRSALRKIDTERIGSDVFKLSFAVSKQVYAGGDLADLALEQAKATILEALRQSPYDIPSNMASVLVDLDVEEVKSFFPLLDWVNREGKKVQESLAVDSPAGAYEYIKSLAPIDASLLKTGPALADEDEALWRYGMLTLVGKHEQTHPFDRSMGFLRSGAIDSFISAELLCLIADQDMMSIPEQLAPLSSFVRFIEHVSGTTLDQDGQQRLAGALWGWPKELEALVRFYRADLERHLIELKGVVDEACDGLIMEPARSYTGEVQTSVQNLINDMNHKNQLPRKIGRNLMSATQSSSKRRTTALVEPVTESRAEPEKEKQAFVLKCINTKGYIHEAGSEHFQKIIDDYLTAYRGMPRIEEDVQILLESLKQMDLSQVEPCMKKIKKTNTFVPMWEFKPSLVAGLQVNNNWAKRTRIIFSRPEPGTLAIAAITHRDKLDQTLKQFKK